MERKIIYDGRRTKKIWINSKKKKSRNHDLPAMIQYPYVLWLKNGGKHRENNLPAVLSESGCKFYKINNISFRNGNLPTDIFSEGISFFRNKEIE